ncbi:MAG: nucleotidyltransferase family protein [Pseudomonadota bacterium]
MEGPELSLFGSALREDFRPDSDIDLLVSFAPDSAWSLLDHARMEQELSDILVRKVDLVTRRAVEGSGNWIRRKSILDSARRVCRVRNAHHLLLFCGPDHGKLETLAGALRRGCSAPRAAGMGFEGLLPAPGSGARRSRRP